MKQLFFLSAFILLMTIATQTNAQKVWEASSKYDADVKVYVVDSKYDADLVVYKVDSKYDADLKIYYASSKYDAGWRETGKKHVMH